MRGLPHGRDDIRRACGAPIRRAFFPAKFHRILNKCGGSVEPEDDTIVQVARTARRVSMSREWMEAASVMLAIVTCYMLVVPV